MVPTAREHYDPFNFSLVVQTQTETILKSSQENIKDDNVQCFAIMGLSVPRSDTCFSCEAPMDLLPRCRRLYQARNAKNEQFGGGGGTLAISRKKLLGSFNVNN